MTHVCVRSMMRRTAARPGVRRRSAPLHNSKKISPAAGHLALFTTENFLLHILGAPPRGPGRPDDATRDGAGTAAARRVSGHPARAAEPQALQLHTLPGFSCTTDVRSDRFKSDPQVRRYSAHTRHTVSFCFHSGMRRPTGKRPPGSQKPVLNPIKLS